MIEEDIDEECLDDPIRLFDSEQNRVFFRPLAKEVIIEDSDDVEYIEWNKQQIEDKERSYSYENNSSILPVTFFDIDSNVELLKQCRPLSVKLVDCERYPWYSKKKIDSTKHNDINLDEITLQEADCIEIMSSDENENYDMILERTTLEDISKIHKELTRIRLESENKTMVKQRFKMLMREEYKRNIFENNDSIDLKKNKGVIGLKITKTNFTIDAKSDKKQANPVIYDPSNVEDNYINKIDTFARLIDKAYRNLQNNINKPPAVTEFERNIQTNKDSVKHSIRHQYTNKFKLNENSKAKKLKDKKVPKNNLNQCAKINTHSSPTLLESLNFKNKFTNVIVEEPQLEGRTIENNSGSCSPLLPCPSHTNKKNNQNIRIISDTTVPTNIKQNINKRNVCKNHLFSANKVIPHYHNEFMQGTKKNESSNLCKSNSNQISLLNRSMPNLSTGKCISHPKLSQDLTSHTFDLTKEMPIQSEVSVSFLDATKESNNHQIPVVSKIPVLWRQNPQPKNQNNNQPTFPIQRIISNRNHFRPNNFIVTPEYPSNITTLPRHVQNLSQNNIYTNHNNSNCCSPESNLGIRTQSLEKSANLYGPRDPLFHVNPKQPLSATNQLPYHQINHCQIPNTNIKYYHCNNNIYNYGNAVCAESAANNKTSLGDKNISNINRHVIARFMNRDTYLYQRTSTIVENAERNVARGTSAYVDKHPHLKQSLEKPPLKMNKTNVMNISTYQQIRPKIKGGTTLNHYTNTNGNEGCIDNVNKNVTLLNNENTSNVNKETVTALLATSYVNKKASRMEENTKHIVGKEASPRRDNNPHFKKPVDQLPQRISEIHYMNPENNQKIDQNNIINIKPVSKGYSPPILPIPTYQKTFEILARIKLNDLEKDSNQPEPNYVSGASASPENLRKRKISETERVSRKITINEYKKRLSAVERVSVEDYKVNIL